MRIIGLIGSFVVLVGCGADGECLTHLEEIEYTAPIAGGDSAQDLMTALGGELVGTITWQDASGFAKVHPAPGEAGLTLTLTHDGGPVQVRLQDEDGVAANERLACPDRVVIDARMTLASDDGALLGSWDVALVHDLGVGHSAELFRIEFVADNEGDFSAALAQANGWEPDSAKITWTGTLTEAGATGYIYLAATSLDPAIGEYSEAVATWSVARP